MSSPRRGAGTAPGKTASKTASKTAPKTAVKTASKPVARARKAAAGSLMTQLDYLYTPSQDVAADIKFYTETLGARLGFAIEGMGARVAMIELTDGPPHILLADHLDGERPVYVFRVDNLRAAAAALTRRGLKRMQQLEIPMGPCASFGTPRGQRLAIYELARPGVLSNFLGRRDF